MKMSIGVEYALHCLLPMIDLQDKSPATVKNLALYQGISESYLAKIFTKLTKAKLVQAEPGVKGGYRLAQSPANISFLDIFEAVEGKDSFFRCKAVRHASILLQEEETVPPPYKTPCAVRKIMSGSEEAFKGYLQQYTLAWLHHYTYTEVLSEQDRLDTIEWFKSQSNGN